MSARVALSVGGLVALAGVLNFLMVDAVAPGHGVRALLVDLAAAMAAAMISVRLTARYEVGVRRIAAGLAEVARGRKDVRFDVGKEPMVANLAHCANDAIGAMVEPVDPSIGPVRVRKRGTTGEIRLVGNGREDEPARASAEPAPTASSRLTPVPSEPVNGVAHAPEAVGKAVTVPEAPAPSDALPPLPAPGPEMPAAEEPKRAPSRHPTVPPILAPAEAVSSPANKVPSDAQQRQEHFRTIFEEYRASLVRLGESDEELTFDGFLDTLTSTEKALMDRHGCRAVRFSVLVQDGRVQLLPRLVR